jgi:hypothetical protein
MLIRAAVTGLQEGDVATATSSKWYHSNVYNAASACKHCGGIVQHETWCSTVNSVVRYAYAAAFRAERLTSEDNLRLHALGVAWN